MHFRSHLAVAFVIISCCMSCWGETNDCADVGARFSLPPVLLRADPRSEISGRETANADRPVASAPVASLASDTTLENSQFFSRVFRSDRFYLSQSRPSPDSGFARFVDRIFTPELVPFGKVSVRSPVLTMVKRKNPLCLLSAFGTDRGLLTFNLLELEW